MIPYGRQSIDEDDIAAVVEALRSDFLTTGPRVAAFEAAICEATGAQHAVACSNGTTALHLAAIAAGLEEGTCAVVPSLTFLASANAVRYQSADVIFADVHPYTGLMEPEHFEEALARAKGRSVKAVFPVHLSGQAADVKAIKALADSHDCRVIVDGAHALGGEQYGKPMGACEVEDMMSFSFHPVKPVTTGEGGAVVTNNEAWAQKMRAARSHGMSHTPEIGPWAYEMDELGYNYRITDLQCALGISQMKKLRQLIERRRALVSLYDELLQDFAPHILPPERAENCNPGWHLYAARIDFEEIGIDRAKFMLALREKGVGSQVHYIPVHTQPYYQKLYGSLELKGAQHYYERTLSLPLYPAMRNEDVEFVVHAIQNIIKEG